jgi:flagellar hook-associated protein 3 FlgL
MRITSTESYQDLLRGLQSIQERIQQSQNEITTGSRINQLSDDPAGAADIVRLTGDKSEMDQYKANAAGGKERLGYADTVLSSVQSMVQRVINLGQLASSNLTSSNPSSVSAYTAEINSLHDQLVATANSTFQGTYIFGGSVTNKPPYVVQSDQSVTYQGNSDTNVVQVGRASTLQVQVPGNQVFSGSINVFSSLQQLSAAITAGDNSAIKAQVISLQQYYTSVSTVQSQIGSLENSAQRVQSDLQSYELARAADQSRIQSADMAKAATDFTQAQTALQAATAAGAKVSQVSLLDYLR